jgi:hypothetical protein
MANLNNRLSKLEAASGKDRTVVIVLDHEGESNDEAMARHLGGHPEDAGANFTVVDTGIYRLPGDSEPSVLGGGRTN